MKAAQRDSSSSATESRRERERIREEREMQRLMGGSGSAPASSSSAATSSTIQSISLTSKGAFKKISATPVSGSGGGWKTVGAPAKKSAAELSWGNEGEDLYDPAYPTPP
jgi:hypothetical protein